MSFSITYDPTAPSLNIWDSLEAFADMFGDVSHTNGNVDPSNSGGFYGGGPFNGTQYAINGVNPASAILAEGDLAYSFMTQPYAHTLYGDLDTVTLGDGLTGGEVSGPYGIADPSLTFDGLGLSSALTEGHSGAVHKVVYGLMSGDATELGKAVAGIFDGLLNVTDSWGDSTSVFNTATLSDLDGNSDGVVTEVEIIGYAAANLVGIPEFDDYLLAA